MSNYDLDSADIKTLLNSKLNELKLMLCEFDFDLAEVRSIIDKIELLRLGRDSIAPSFDAEDSASFDDSDIPF